MKFKLAICSLFILLAAGCSKTQPTARVASPARADIKVTFLATGTTEAREIQISAENWGTLEDVLVKKDDFVKKGQVLAVVDDPEARDQLRTMEVDLATQRSSREEMLHRMDMRRIQLAADEERREAEWRRAKASYKESLAGASPERLQQAEASVDEAEAYLNQAHRERERMQQLFEEDIASQAQVEKAKMEEEIAIARRTRAIKSLEEMQKGLTKEARATLQANMKINELNADNHGQTNMELVSMEQQLRTKNLEIARWEEEAAALRQRLARTRITSPLDGQVIQVFHFPGENVNRGVVLFNILNPEDIWIEAEVSEQDSSYVSVGQEVSVNLPSVEGPPLNGIIESMGATLRTPPGSPGNARFLPIKVRLKDGSKDLKPGIEADVEGTRVLAQNVLTVPHQAVIRDGERAFVVVVNAGVTKRVQVELGASDSEKIEVKSGLNESQSVVLDQPGRLADGTQVLALP